MSRTRAATLAEIEAAYRAHGHHVQRRAMLILGDENDACEVVQEVFLSLVDHPEQCAGRSATGRVPVTDCSPRMHSYGPS